jgi:hypothetical protein
MRKHDGWGGTPSRLRAANDVGYRGVESTVRVALAEHDFFVKKAVENVRVPEQRIVPEFSDLLVP